MVAVARDHLLEIHLDQVAAMTEIEMDEIMVLHREEEAVAMMKPQEEEGVAEEEAAEEEVMLVTMTIIAVMDASVAEEDHLIVVHQGTITAVQEVPAVVTETLIEDHKEMIIAVDPFEVVEGAIVEDK